MNTLTASLSRGLRRLVSRKIYLTMMIVVPLVSAWFFLDMMSRGLPLPVPAALVDMDGSALSRSVARNLSASQFVEIDSRPISYHEALEQVRSGEIFGFFYIPERFQQKALGGGQPTLSFYSNMSIFVPGTMSFKGFKTTAVTTKGALVLTTMTAAGVNGEQAQESLQPVVIQNHMPGNPWMNYSIYLTNSFGPGVLALMVLLITVFTICEEIKRGTSPQWLDTAGGSMLVALTGKLLPQTIIFSITGIAMQSMFWGYYHFPLHNHAGHMIAAMVMMVVANQALGVVIAEALPNLRLGLSVASLIGILSFSIAGFSFPVEQMYGAIGIFSYILPLRYYFLIYVDQALNGLPIYYSRFYYVALTAFILVPLLGLGRLRRRCENPIYVP